MNKTQKVKAIAQHLGITERQVWVKLKSGQIALDQFTQLFGEPQEILQSVADGAREALSADVLKGFMRDIMQEFRQEQQGVVQFAAENGELKERLKWLAGENEYLKREIKLLKAPAEEPMTEVQEVLKPAAPSVIDRLRAAWYALGSGGVPQPQK